AATYDVVAGGERSLHTGLQQSELLERAPVQWEIANLPLTDETTDGAGCQVHKGGVGAHLNLFRHRSNLEHAVDDGCLADGQPDPAMSEGAEPCERDADFIFPGRQRKHLVMPVWIGRQLPSGAGAGITNDDGRTGQDCALRVLHRTLNRSADQLCGRQGRDAEEKNDAETE